MIECHYANEAMRELYAKAAKERDELAAKIAAGERDGWRSVEESLPEPGERVLVDNDGMVMECYRKQSHGTIVWSRMGMPENWLHPKYWRPLPLPCTKIGSEKE